MTVSAKVQSLVVIYESIFTLHVLRAMIKVMLYHLHNIQCFENKHKENSDETCFVALHIHSWQIQAFFPQIKQSSIEIKLLGIKLDTFLVILIPSVSLFKNKLLKTDVGVKEARTVIHLPLDNYVQLDLVGWE